MTPRVDVAGRARMNDDVDDRRATPHHDRRAAHDHDG
jgi:hypothetical protein